MPPPPDPEDDLDDEDADDDDESDGTDDGTGGTPPDIEAPIRGTLPELVDAIAHQFDDVTRHETPAGIDYLVRDRPFVRVAGDRATFRLRAEIAVAASRTPDTTPSTEGPDWVTFAPPRLDRYSVDRATAWFELGHRLAAEAARPH